MTTFLFWNLNRKALNKEVAAVVKDYQVDALFLAESPTTSPDMIQTLTEEMPDQIFAPPTFSLCSKIQTYLRYSSNFWAPVLEDPRYTIGEYKPAAKKPILIAVTHLPSRRNNSVDSINSACVEFAARIREAEDRKGTDRTIALGDFNLDPFDHGMVSASGLHGAMSRAVALRIARTVQGRSYPFFYNPMWSRIGDDSDGPPGSLYYSSSEHVAYFWHMFDQLLIRPSLISEFSTKTMHFVTEVRGASLLLNQKPNGTMYSDHLPLVFSLNLPTHTGDL